jgi:uncharacterized protein (DUF1778 family)
MAKTQTSWVVKNRYNIKTYDRIEVKVKKGEKEKIKNFATKQGKSLNAFIVDLIVCEMGKNTDK